MDKKKKLLFGIHMHQPVDNFLDAVDDAVESCYKPLFKILKNYPFFKFSLHSSGWLLNYIKKNHKSTFLDIKEMSRRGQIEFFSAGFYEPVLPSLPSIDRVEQIKKLNTLLKEEFHAKPKGVWLTERVWEDGIIHDLKQCGIKYVMVDDYHFLVSGFKKEELGGYYLTENGGEKIALFPINKELRYAIPFLDAKESILKIKSCKGEGAIIFDDAEKFGLWPETYEWVYENGWLEEFLTLLRDDKEIETTHFRDFYEDEKTKGLAYLQNSSYIEMGEWSLKKDEAVKFEEILELSKERFKEDAIKFVKGGSWKNFFIKYEESNRLHKIMIDLSKHRVDDKDFMQNLYKSQTNDVFWHGVFGGIYLPNLRDNAYRYISKCENIRYKDKTGIEIKDINFDGYYEIKSVTNDLIAMFESKNGGSLSMLLLRDKEFNLQNSLTRREEIYHKDISQGSKTKEQENSNIKTIHEMDVEVGEEVKEALYFDWYIKNSFIDHISNDSFTLENFKKCQFWEYGDFANQPFITSVKGKKIILKRDGGIYFDTKFDTTITKTFRLIDNQINYKFDLKTKSENEYIYALEFNLHFPELDRVLIDDICSTNEFEIEKCNHFIIKDNFLKKSISFKFNKNFKLLSTPLKTVSKSEKGYDVTLQGINFALLFSFSKELSISAKIKVEDE